MLNKALNKNVEQGPLIQFFTFFGYDLRLCMSAVEAKIQRLYSTLGKQDAFCQNACQ